MTCATPAAPRAYLDAAKAGAGLGPEWPPVSDLAEPQAAAVVGAGTMGTGIAQTLAGAGLATQIIDADAARLRRSIERIRASLVGAVGRGQIDSAEAERRLARLRPGTSWDALHDADLVIEAVYENLAVKQQVLARLGAICPPRTWFASNTSTLDIDALATASGRPAQVVGMHFLTPAHVVPLVEVVRGAATDARTLAAAAALARHIGKLPVQTGNAWGFIGNRLFEGYLREADALVLAGIAPERLDAALEAFGMAMGPCRTVDMAGLDIASQVITERGARLPGGWPAAHRIVTRLLAAMGRLGTKTGRGYYLYDGRLPRPDPDLARVAAGAARELGVPALDAISDGEIVRRCIAPLVSEGRCVLAEGIARRASDIDLVWVVGYGFPAERGGPMYLAERHRSTDG